MRRVIDRIRDKIRDGLYVLSFHAIDEMAAEGLTEEEVEESVLAGRIVRRQKDRLGRRKYTIEGGTNAGRRVRTVCRFSDSGEQVVVITVYELEEGTHGR